MFPILFKLGPFVIYSYGFFLALAYLVATFILWREGKKQGYSEEKLIDFSVACLLASIVGGRLFYTLINLSYFSDNPGKIFAFWEGGFAYFGSFFLVLFVGTSLVRRWKWSFFQIADIGALAALGAMVVSSFGSFLSGNDFGKATSLPWGVALPFLIGKRHPTQIYAAIAALVILFFLYRVYKGNLTTAQALRSGAVFFYFILFSSVSRIFIEQFRGDSTFFLGFPLASLLSLVLATFALLALYYYQFRDFKSDVRNFSKYILGINLRLRKTFGKN